MELLKQRIMENGRCFEGGILKVDSFINHQMDPDLMKIIGKEFAELYRDSGVNKILTIEASGIAPAIMAGAYMHLPVVFAKKKQPKTMERMLATTIHSFTKDRDYTVCRPRPYRPGGAGRCLDSRIRIHHREELPGRWRYASQSRLPRGKPRRGAQPRQLQYNSEMTS